MAKNPAKDVLIYLDEFNISGYMNATEQSIDQETPDVTAFSDTGPRRVVGNYEVGHSDAGFFDGADDLIDEILHALIDDDDHFLTKLFQGEVETRIAYDSVVRLASKPLTMRKGEAILLQFDSKNSGGIVRGMVLRTAAITGTGAGTGRNQGATTAGQTYAAIVRVVAVSGAGSITIRIQESQNDGSPDAYADISGMTATFTAIGVQRLTTTAATEAWKRVNIQAFATFTSVTILVTAGLVQGS